MMATAKRFEELEVWQSAREMTNLVYGLSNTGKFSKDYGLKDQVRRSAVSIMSNIAEGFESRTQSLFIDFLGRAKGSAGELRSQLYCDCDRWGGFLRLVCGREAARAGSGADRDPPVRSIRLAGKQRYSPPLRRCAWSFGLSTFNF